MRRLFVIILFFILTECPLFTSAILPATDNPHFNCNTIIEYSNDYKSDFEQAKTLINANQYQEALDILLKLINQDPQNCNLNFLVGFCYYNIEAERNKALPYLENAILNTVSDYDDNSSKEKSAPVYAYFYLGKSYQWIGRLEAALMNFEKFRAFLVNKSDKLINQKNFDIFNDVNAAILQIKTAQQLVTNPLHVEFVKIPMINNSNYSCYGAQLCQNANAIYYSRERLNDKIRGKSDMFVLRKTGQNWVKNEQAGQNLNSPYNDVFNSVSADDKFLLFSSDRKGVFNVFYSMHENNKWSEPLDNLSINSNYNETYAVLSKDGSKIIFVSDKPGGFGGKDLYKIEKKSDGSWSQVENLGFTINTAKDEDTPFLSDDGNRLYFSSSGHSSIGGADIFYSDYKNNMWMEPVNMGYPINSLANDLYFKYYPENNLMLFSSNRKTGGIVYEILGARFSDSTSANEIFTPIREATSEDTATTQQKQDDQSIQLNKQVLTEKPVVAQLSEKEKQAREDSIFNARQKHLADSLETINIANNIKLMKAKQDSLMKVIQKQKTDSLEASNMAKAEKEKKASQDSLLKINQKHRADSLEALRIAKIEAKKQARLDSIGMIKDKLLADSLKASKITANNKERQARKDSIAKVREKQVSDSLEAIRIAKLKSEIKSGQDKNATIKARLKQDSIAKAQEFERKQALAKATQEKLRKLKESARIDSMVNAQRKADSLKIEEAKLASKQKFEQSQQLAKQVKTDSAQKQVTIIQEKPKAAAENLEIVVVTEKETGTDTTQRVLMDHTQALTDTAKIVSEKIQPKSEEKKAEPEQKTKTEVVEQLKTENDQLTEKQKYDSLMELKRQSEAKLTQYLEQQKKKQEADSAEKVALMEKPLKKQEPQKTVVKQEKKIVVAEPKKNIPKTDKVVTKQKAATIPDVSLSTPSGTSADTIKRFTVQVGAGWMKIKYFKNIDKKKICYGPDGLARFVVGEYTTRKEADQVAEQMRLLGFTDAWVAAIDDKRCSWSDNELMVEAKVIDKSAAQLNPNLETHYTVQVGAGNMKIRYFKNLRQVKVCNGKDGITRFTFGEFNTLNDALQVKNKIIQMGYLDAWTPPIDENRCKGN